MPSQNAKEVQARRAAEEDARRRLGPAQNKQEAAREEPSAQRPAMEDPRVTPRGPDPAGAPHGEMSRTFKTPEQAERAKQYAEVVERLDAINASLQQLISLLGQAK